MKAYIATIDKAMYDSLKEFYDTFVGVLLHICYHLVLFRKQHIAPGCYIEYRILGPLQFLNGVVGSVEGCGRIDLASTREDGTRRPTIAKAYCGNLFKGLTKIGMRGEGLPFRNPKNVNDRCS